MRFLVKCLDFYGTVFCIIRKSNDTQIIVVRQKIENLAKLHFFFIFCENSRVRLLKKKIEIDSDSTYDTCLIVLRRKLMDE